jgi:hypothetical protein
MGTESTSAEPEGTAPPPARDLDVAPDQPIRDAAIGALSRGGLGHPGGLHDGRPAPTPGGVLALQRVAGNRAVGAYLARLPAVAAAAAQGVGAMGGTEVQTGEDAAAPEVVTSDRVVAPTHDTSVAVAQARRLAPLIGNRAMGSVLARTPKDLEEKPILVGPEVHRPTMQVEVSIKGEFPNDKTKSFSGKVTFARWGDMTDTKSIKLGSAGKEWTEEQPEGEQRLRAVKAVASLFEQKATREYAAGKVANKVQSTLANLELVGDPLIPGWNFKFNLKALEYQINRTARETDLNLLTVSGTVEANVTEFVSQVMDIPLSDRVKWRVVVAAEFKWVPSPGDLARIKDIWKSGKVVEAEAKVFAETTEKLREIDWHRKDIARDLKRERGQVEHLQKLVDEATDGTGRRRGERLQRAKDRLAKLELRDRELQEAGEKLKATLDECTTKLADARKTMAAAYGGMKGRFGQTVGRMMARRSWKIAGALLARAIPVLNAVSAVMDLLEIAHNVDKWRRNGEWTPFGSGEDSGEMSADEGEPGGSASGVDPGGSAAEGAETGSAEGVPGGDPSAPEGGSGAGGATPGDSAGTGGDPSAPEGGSGAGGATPGDSAGTGTDTGNGTGSGGAGGGQEGAPADSAMLVPEAPGSAPGPAAARPAVDPELGEAARSVFEIVRGNEIPLTPEVASQLDSIVPERLTDVQLAELRRRIERIKGEGLSDPYDIVGRIHEEVDRVVKGEPAVEVFVDGKKVEEESTPGTPPVGETLPGAGTGQAPAEAPKSEPPKTIRPPIPAGFFQWDPTAKELVLPADRRDELLGREFPLGGGLVVGVLDLTLENEKFPEFTLVSLTFDVIVLNTPLDAGPDYPWKPGDKESFTDRAARSHDSASFTPIEDAPVQQAAFRDALTYANGKFTLARKGAPIDWPGATLRIDGLAGEPTVRADEKREIHTVAFLVTPTQVSDPQAMVVTDDGPIILKPDVQVTIRATFTIEKGKK